jgi:transcriptional regulator with XRE-family HTH domain
MLSSEEITEEFAKLMADYLNRKGWSLTRLSTESGVSLAHLSRINKGKRNTPTFDRVWRIARVLEMPLELLITRLKLKEEGRR